MKKPKILFPFTEAGLGHITPMKAIADEFEKLYGDKVECVRSQFFTEGGKKNLAKFEQALKNEVIKHNKHTFYGYYATFNMDFWGVTLANWATMKFLKLGSRHQGYAYMDELQPDLVFSTHWATNYYARHAKCKPLTMVYCPDARINPLFAYPSDMLLISTQTGLQQGLQKYPRLNNDNFKCVPFLIRGEAFDIVKSDPKELRKKLGYDTEKFMVVLVEGGYGIGKMEKICSIALERDLPITLVPVCGKNTELFERFMTFKSKGKTDFKPIGYADNLLEILHCADLFCGKSGASAIAEPCFMGVPQIITKYATNIEQHIGEYYIDYVGSALRIFEPSEVVDKIEEFMRDDTDLKKMKAACEKIRHNYGARKSAELIFQLLCTRFPELASENSDKTGSV